MIPKLANSDQRIVISKDVDFLESFIEKAEQKKLIMVKTGNISNKQLIKLFDATLEIIIKMISRSNLIEINQTEIAEHS